MTENTQPGQDEMFCTECGSVIKKRAEICPECGVKQQSKQKETPQQQGQAPANNSGAELTERRQYELEKIANKNKTTVILLGIFLTPVAYWTIGKKGLALLNFFTLNFFLLGFIIVPIHCNSIIDNAREELRIAGVGGY